MISVEEKVFFCGEITTEEEHQVLKKAGFIHLTGIGYRFNMKDDIERIGAKLNERQLGKYGENNGKCVVITTGGEVWLKSGRLPGKIAERFCPNGGGAFVPLSNCEYINYNDLLDRIADSHCGIIVDPKRSPRG